MKNPKLSFTRLSLFTGYIVGLTAMLMFVWTKHPQDFKLIPLAKVFVYTAVVSERIEKSNKDNSPPQS